jgi:3-hydroxyisobutyrate dehydrogenase
MTQRVAILGLGTMGIGMARNLLKTGFSLTAYNRTRAKADLLAVDGAHIADTPQEAVHDADVISYPAIACLDTSGRRAKA